MTTSHERFIRESYALAVSASRKGNHPFGALLVLDDQILLTAENTVVSDRDPTRHAEMNLVSRAAQTFAPDVLARSILYTSTEPCVMCTGAIYWAGISTIVYGCPAEALGRMSGGSFVFSCRELLAHGSRPFQVIGPILEAEGIHIHEHCWPSTTH